MHLGCTYFTKHGHLPIIWLVKYPKANADNIQPCKCMFQPNTLVIGTMAMGIITLSALLMKLAKLQSATMRDVRVNHLILAILIQFLSSGPKLCSPGLYHFEFLIFEFISPRTQNSSAETSSLVYLNIRNLRC